MPRRLAGFALFAGGMTCIVAGILAKRVMSADWLLFPLHTAGFFGGLLPGLLLMTWREWDEDSGV